jgi:carbamoyl-phosphate synthase large subunit
MPARSDLHTILVIGSGPIVIGQACEFDYSGTQAVKALRAQGYRVVLVNSNPATIMTDPDLADATYLEPITPEMVEAVVAAERPDALLPTLGGQTALNVTAELHRRGVLERYGVELIGASFDAIETAEDREAFREAMIAAGLQVPDSRYCHSVEEAVVAAAEIGYPVLARPSYILGGEGSGQAQDEARLRAVVEHGLRVSPVGGVLIERSLVGWKEFEFEVMRDRKDNAVIVCSIENLDPMGVHTGDSITVAPAQTLSDREYQEMRDDAITCLRAVGVETGGSNVQFAVDPATGRRLVIEMNPRVSRSSALASKATGFPIAKIAALLAVGFTLDEICNDITEATPASFEPALDYVVVKVPRFDSAKFPASSDRLGTSMHSVGEAMAIGRTFPEALQKALRSLEVGAAGLNADPGESVLRALSDGELRERIGAPTPGRIFEVGEALRRGFAEEDVAALTGIDLWFVDQMASIVELRSRLEAEGPGTGLLRLAKRSGFSDRQLAYLWGIPAAEVARLRAEAGIAVTFKTVDTCAAEFEARTPYFYGTFEDEDESPPPSPRTVMILGSGPNRIGQGIEFDYCCVHAAMALGEAGYQTVMVNCNPETVSTDYDTSDRLYFEPLTIEDVLAVVAVERPEAVVVQLGGQTPLSLAHALADAGCNIAGTSPDSIDIAEDRERFSSLCRRLGIPQPPHGTVTSVAEAAEVVDRIGLPALVRPSYVLGGRAMRVVYTLEEVTDYLGVLFAAAPGSEVDLRRAPVLIDRFLENAGEVDVDAVFDGEEVLVGGIMEHIEEAGIHSGDSACVVPPQGISATARRRILRHTEALARGLEVRGLLNMQFAVRGDEVFLLEANPRASRTIPFISKATGVPLAKVAARVMMGARIADLRAAGLVPEGPLQPTFVAVKGAVLPWLRFPEEDDVLGPEMRATGEVMGIASDFGTAYAKALVAGGRRIPTRGTVFFSLADRDKEPGILAARRFVDVGFRLLATGGTSRVLAAHGLPAAHVDKVGEGPWDPVRLIEEGKIDLVVNTPRGRRARGDGSLIRRAARRAGIPCVTSLGGAMAVGRTLLSDPLGVGKVKSLQAWHLSSEDSPETS